MAIRVFEIQAPAAIAVVNLTRLGSARICPVRQVLVADAPEGCVEFRLSDEKCVVLRRDVARGLGVVQRHAVVRLHHEKMTEPRRGRKAKDISQERRRPLLVTTRHDGVIQIYAHNLIVPTPWLLRQTRCLDQVESRSTTPMRSFRVLRRTGNLDALMSCTITGTVASMSW